MTVINGIELDELTIRKNETKSALLNNDKIEEKLHVIMVISNPCEYIRRWELARKFIKHMNENDDIILYIVELIYPNQTYHITDSDNSKHLQLKTEHVLWHKENMINLGVKNLLPENWKAMAWVDADLEFENIYWASDTLKILNGYKDIVQCYSHCADLNKKECTMRIFTAFGYNYEIGKKYNKNGNDYWHPGFCWAITRKAYEKIGGLYQNSILGSGDHNMALALIGSNKSINTNADPSYKKNINELVNKISKLRLGYVPGVIRHFYHGSKANRKYMERWKILVDNKYNPYKHITIDENGILIPTPECPQQILTDIIKYFKERNEDE